MSSLRPLRWIALVAIAAALAAACSSSSKKSDQSSGTTVAAAGGATARGVEADKIKIGLSYPDLEALAKTGIIKVDNGDYATIGKVLVDDINAQGGVNNRKLELFTEKYDVLEANAQLATCSKLTEDDKVFAVLGGFIGDNNLCVAQQHSTTLISGYGSGFNQIGLDKARAPWATWGASDERAIKALVKILKQQGSLEGKTIGVYGTLSASKPMLDLTTNELQAAGYTVKSSAINDAPASDAQAFNAQDKVIGNKFRDEGVDTVFVLVTVPPGTNFDNIDYHPTFYSPQTSLISPGAFTNPYNKFPLVAGLAASADPNAGFDSPAMKHCREVYKTATGKDVLPFSEEQKQGKSTGFAAMATTCSALQMFVGAAKVAGANLTPETWKKGLESLGSMELPAAPVASFAPNKPDGQDSFQLEKLNPAWKPNAGIEQFLAVGDPINFTG